MNCGNISTGVYAAAATGCGADKSFVVKSPGKVILFSPESPYDDKYSPSFTVKAGVSVLIDAYNMPDDSRIFVNRLVKTTTPPTIGSNCDPCAMHGAYGTNGLVLFRERMRLGCTSEYGWCLQKYTDESTITQLLINIPGTYELELETVDMLGDLEVELMEWSNSATIALPSQYYAGLL